jgi:hypothetical protein
MNVTFERREAIRAIRHFRPGRAPGASESDEISVAAGAGTLVFTMDGFQAGIEAFVMEPGLMYVPREYFDRLLRGFKEERLTLQASPEGFQIGHYHGTVRDYRKMTDTSPPPKVPTTGVRSRMVGHCDK